MVLLFMAVSTIVLKPDNAPLSALLLMIAIQIVPLLVFAPAVWLKQSYGLLALTLLVLVYMGFATMNCFAHGLKQILAFVELVLDTWLIMACSKAVKSLPRGHGAQ